MKISIVVPLYNKAEHIKRALDSVLAQTYQDFELIVVDDGSTDGGADVVRQYDDPRIRVIRQANAGVSEARNRGIAEAKTEWIALLDADDEWMPSYLERSLAFAERHPGAGVVITNFIMKTSGKVYIGPNIAEEGVLEDYFVTALKLGHSPAFASATIARRKAFLEVGGFPVGVAHGEDVDTWNRLACTNSFCYVAEPLVIYNDDVYGAQAKYVREGYPYPCTVRTLRGPWAERIPAHLRRSVAEYLNIVLYVYISNQLGVGRVWEARRVLLFECRPTRMTWRKYLIAARACFTPHWLRLLRRRLEIIRHFV